MDRTQKLIFKGRIDALKALVGSAKGTATAPAIPNAPIVALPLICTTLEEIVKTLEEIVEKI